MNATTRSRQERGLALFRGYESRISEVSPGAHRRCARTWRPSRRHDGSTGDRRQHGRGMDTPATREVAWSTGTTLCGAS